MGDLTQESVQDALNSENNVILPDQKTEVNDTKSQEFDNDELAAIFINQSHKQFKKLGYEVANRKKRAVVRVLEAVLFEPFEKVELLGKEEQQLFDLCQKVMYHKGVLLKYSHERFNKIKQGELSESEEKG